MLEVSKQPTVKNSHCGSTKENTSILRWLNPFHNNNSNNNNNNSGNNSNNNRINSKTKINRNNHSNLLATRGSTPNLDSHYSLDSEVNQYRGVEGLKQFWNNRISATKEKSATLSNCSSPTKNSAQLTPSKSINCLLKSLDNDRNLNNNNEDHLDGHKSIDNFYKYKTADTKKRSSFDSPLSESSEQKLTKECLASRRISNSFGINFPLIATTEKGEKIHWARRDDIFINRKNKVLENITTTSNLNNISDSIIQPNSQLIKSNKINNGSVGNILESPSKKLSSYNKQGNNQILSDLENFNSLDFKLNVCEDTTLDMAIKNSSQTLNSTNIIEMEFNHSADKTDGLLTNSLGNMRDCSHNSSATSLISSTDSPIKRKNPPTARKYSFKTHSKTYHHSNRKIHYQTHHGNKVATLTQQFNQMVQKDSAILDEIKKKNGVLIASAGQVYKIKEDIDKKKNLAKRCGSSESEDSGSISKATGKKKLILKKVKSGDGSVKATIRKFEDTQNILKAHDNQEYEIKSKPQIPKKSENVLKRTKDIATRNIQKKIKPTTLDIQKTLEDIKEEAKTPIQEVEKTDDKVPKLITNKKEYIEETIEVAKTPSEFNQNFESNKNQNLCIETTLLDFDKENNAGCNDTDTQYCTTDKSSQDFSSEESKTISCETSDTETEDSHSKKSKYAKIYEKFRFRPTLFSNKKLQKLKKSNNDSTDNSDYEEEKFSKCLDSNTGKDEIKEPNQSFLFKSSFIEPDTESRNLFEAVNKPLVENSKPKLIEAKNYSFIYNQLSKARNDINDLTLMSLGDGTIIQAAFKTESNDIASENNENVTCKENSKQTQKSFLFSRVLQNIEKKENKIEYNCDDIYQTVGEAISGTNSKCEAEEDSSENYETVPDTVDSQTEDGYEIFDPPSGEISNITSALPKTSETRNTTDELPALPAPKRNLLSCGEPPPRPKKSPQLDRTKLPEIPVEPEHHFNDENIYDTIKGSESASHCYEMLNGKCSPKLDNISNCYESINSVLSKRNFGLQLRNCDSISTISSDHKTNSLYGMPVSGNPSIALTEGSSDNSDEWIDISDDDSSKQQFIIIRERPKCHRSPDWSKRVRDQRTQKQSQYYDDDSDHYYEPLYPTVIAENNTTLTKSNQYLNSIIPMPNNNVKVNSTTILDSSKQQKQSHHHHHHHNTEDYHTDDSFTDDETDEEVKKTDSGVDISKSLPDPPGQQHSTNQVYAFVKKVKNFISNKKHSSKSLNDSNGKQYENTQFYVNSSEYQNTQFPLNNTDDKKPIQSKKKTPKLSKKCSSKNSSTDLYENTEFHTPRTIPQKPDDNNTAVKSESSPIELKPRESNDLVNRRKSKSEKSFKAKLRKSLTSSSNDNSNLTGARSTFYVVDSNDYDSGIFEKTSNQNSNEQVSNNEKTEPTISTTSKQTTDVSTMNRKNKRSNRSPDLNRRKTVIGIRPNDPPPPPPIDKKSSTNVQKRNSSWYAECGVFKTNGLGEEQRESRGERHSNTSWYAEAGLYQTSGASVASSGSSGVSTGGEGGPGDDNSHSMFLNEPLYQIYSAAKLESISRDMEDQESTDGYEEIGTLNKKPPRPSALQLVSPKQGPSRTLWSEIQEVINSGVLSTLTPTEKRLQEAKFEILTSEASYLKSLNLLKTHFMNHPAFRDSSVLHPSDRKTLFSHIIPVHECSDRLLSDLENCWQDNIMLTGLSRHIFKNAEKYFHVYIAFCEHQGKMDRTLRRLKDQKGLFSQTLESLEKDAVCCGLNLHSFLMLPMQRVTRLPLLIDAVFSKVKSDDDEYDGWKMTLSILNQIVKQCNEAANRCEQAYEIEKLSRQIEFPSNIRSIPIAPVGIPAPNSKPRTLVKKGELTQLIWRRADEAKLTFGKKFHKSNIYAFLFTDLLILTKRKSDEQFIVFDYCSRIMLTIQSGDAIPQLPIKDVSQNGKNLIMMTLLENHEGKTIELILSCPSVSEQTRWLEATAPPESETPGEKLYEQWDCPQVITKHEYIGTEPDLLSLEAGDVVNVHRKMPDGWYQGERIRDGMTGWFPGNYTEEVNSAHVRARNLKTRYRLLTFTASYLEMQKKK